MNKRPFNDEGREWFIAKLLKWGFYDVSGTTDGQGYGKGNKYDLYAWYEGKKYLFELKSRNFPSYSYGDVIMELNKTGMTNFEADGYYLVNFWTNAYTMIDIKRQKSDKIETKWAPAHTNPKYGSTALIEKVIMRWYNRNLKLFDYD